VHDQPSDFDAKCDPPYEFVRVRSSAESPLPHRYRGRLLVHTVHDGSALPREFRYHSNGKPVVDLEQLQQLYVQGRDWGANLVAHKLASALGVSGYARCRIARVLLDFNRFPGSTPPGTRDPLERLSISKPFNTALSHAQKLRLLEGYYDRISDLIEEQILTGKLIMIGVHTYDEHNPSQTKRPDCSLITTPGCYQREARMPFGLFDPLYPDVLAESSCSRVLRDRISLNLERSGYRVSHNHPYPLPEGGMEVRAQVWYFFDYVRQRFEREFPATQSRSAYRLVWMMLLNTNLRLAEAESLRGYLHRYRKVLKGQERRFEDARRAYERVADFVRNSSVITDYRRSSRRPSNIAFEVRKDLVCSLQDGRLEDLTPEQEQNATQIGRVVAKAIRTYLEIDREEPRVIEMHDPGEFIQQDELAFH